MKTILIFVYLAISGTVLAAPPRPDYVVRIAENEPRLIKVECTFQLEKPELSMADWGAEHLPMGWATFMRNLVVRDAGGRELVLEGGPQAWKIKADQGSSIKLNYEIALEHERHPWPHGLDESSYVKPDAIFLTGMALFISPDDTASATVKFELPAGWRASTPWPLGSDGRFAVASGDELLSNAIMIGRQQELRFQQDGMQVTLAVGGAMKASAEMLAQVMKPAIAAYARAFGGVPKSNYLVTLHEGLTDGGAFANSYSMLSSEPLTRTNLIDWGHIVAHETLHLWNGTGMQPKMQMDWFKEGFTDYLTLLTLRRLKLTDDVLFTKKLESHVRRTLGEHALSLADAGRDKKANWGWIYGGGAMAALVLDVRVREATAGRKCLEDVMRAMFIEFKYKRYDLDDLTRVTNMVAGVDVSDFFKQHISGREPLPLKATFAKLGYTLITNTQGEAFLITQTPHELQRLPLAGGWRSGR